VQKSEAVLYNTKPAVGKLADNTFWLSESGDLTEIAHNLFMLIQKLDMRGYTQLHVEQAEDVDIGIAVNDRLIRAAAKR
jgi:L-threonylcarbamoyladenylate synthase